MIIQARKGERKGREVHRRWRGRKDAEEKQKEAAEVGRNGRVRLKVKSCREVGVQKGVRDFWKVTGVEYEVVQLQRVTRGMERVSRRARPAEPDLALKL